MKPLTSLTSFLALMHLLLGLACNESTANVELNLSSNALGSSGAVVLESCIGGVKCVSRCVAYQSLPRFTSVGGQHSPGCICAPHPAALGSILGIPDFYSLNRDVPEIFWLCRTVDSG